MVAPSEQERLRAILAEARTLVENQRRAVRDADFALLLATASGFHRLAAQLGSLSPATILEEKSDDIMNLQNDISNQFKLLTLTMSATPKPARPYSNRKIVDSASQSLIVDSYT